MNNLPSDDEILAWASEEEFFLFCPPDDVLDIVKSALQKFRGQSAITRAAAEIGRRMES